MKKLMLYVMVVLFIGAVSSMAQEKPWFDMPNCDFCKHLLTDSLFLPNTVWELHDVANGLMIVTIVKPEFKASYQKIQAEMEKAGKEMMEGKPVKMCGFCEYYGKLMQSGAKIETVKGEWGDVSLITSDKPEVLKMIKEFGQRSREEMAKGEQPKKEHKH
jgi:hypothetical protein